MNHCPPELHSYICSLACTDDGYTARSLSLVSKYYAQITLPYLYQSLCVTEPSQIHSLAHKLQQTPVHQRRIHHLFISDKSGGRELVNSIMTILALAAPTLETLALVASSPLNSTSLLARLFRTCFPHLYELTIYGHYPFPSSPSCFPSLERLHLLGNRNPHGLLRLGALESSMPTLTHLRISGLSLAVSFSQELYQAFTSSAGDDEECMFPAKLPPKLERLVIECGPELLSSRPNAAAQLKDQVMVKNLESLEERAGKEGHRTRFLVLPRSTKDISSDDIRAHWVDRLRGKEGCWSCT